MSFDNDDMDEEEFTNQPIEGQMSIFELPQQPEPNEEEVFTNQPVQGQLDLFEYYDAVNSRSGKVENLYKNANSDDDILDTNLQYVKVENIYSDENVDNKVVDNKKINDKQKSNQNIKSIEENKHSAVDKNKISDYEQVDERVSADDYHENIVENECDINGADTEYVDADNEPIKTHLSNSNNLSDESIQFDVVENNQDTVVGAPDYEQSETQTQTYKNELKDNTEFNYQSDEHDRKIIYENSGKLIRQPKKYQREGRKMANTDEPIKSNVKGGGGNNEGGLLVQSIDEVLHNSMIPYSEFVLLDRALPRVEDGLKPVQRRILYTMLELGMTPDKAYRKCARIVGDCLGKYHPHGDTSVYDALVRMAQPFNMRGILVQGHGNFGSVDGDSAAAMRYTEAKLAPLAMELLRDLEKETVKWSFNFDDTLKEPDTLPGRFPNLLVNGAVGIAVGLATNIPTHNLNEVIDGVVALIEHPSIQLKEMMKIIKGPDFPTGAIISTDELYQAYETGRGKITMRAKTHFEDAGNGKTNIVITEIPYQKNKSSLLAKIADVREDKKGVLLGIQDIKDESDRNGIRAVITVKAGYNANDILNLLYKYTDLQSSFGINMVAIADGKPKQLGLMTILKYYLDYQVDIIVRRTRFDLNNAKERMHILEGLHIAIVNIDEVVAIIKNSSNTTEAKVRLRQRFLLSEKQAQAILDMRLARLTSLEVYKIEQEIAELKVLIEKLTAILNSKRLQLDVIKNELLDIKRKYSMPRLTKIVKSFGEIDVESILEANKVVEETIVALTQSGTIKRMQPKHFETTVKEFNSQLTENELHYNILKTSTDKTLVAFTNKGNACRISVEDIKEVKWRDKGTNFRAICKELDVDEKILSLFEINKNDDREIIFGTKHGLLKRTALKEYDVSKQKFTAIKLKEDDELVSAVLADNKKTILMVTKHGMALNCEIGAVPTSGRVSQGVKGMNLSSDDCFVFVGLMPLNAELVLATKKGFAKRFNVGGIELSQRARKGSKVFAINENDEIIFVDIEKGDADYVVKFYGNDNFVKKNIKEFFPDKKQGKGKSLSTNKNGLRITSIYKYNIE